jgi:hypothetical protein
MQHGYIYCFSNPSMNGILKIGMTLRTPCTRLCEANSSDTWRPPTPYVLEFAKKVLNPKQKEYALHSLLTRYTERIHMRREFFRVSPNEVKAFFDLIDGEPWSDKENKIKLVKRYNRKPAKVFEDGDYWREEEPEGEQDPEEEQEPEEQEPEEQDTEEEVEMEFDF